MIDPRRGGSTKAALPKNFMTMVINAEKLMPPRRDDLAWVTAIAVKERTSAPVIRTVPVGAACPYPKGSDVVVREWRLLKRMRIYLHASPYPQSRKFVQTDFMARYTWEQIKWALSQ